MISYHDWWPWAQPGYITMTRRQSKIQWSGGIAAHHAPKNSECKNPLEMSRLDFLGDKDGILHIDYLPKGNWRTFWSKRRHGNVTKWFLFLHDNAPAHRELTIQKTLAYLGFQCFDHPPYSSDLAPTDYHLFPGLKKQLKGRHFSSDAEITAAAETWLDGLVFLSGLQKLEQQAKKCIELRGEYVE